MKHLLNILLIPLLLILCPVSSAQEDPDVLEFALITDVHAYGNTADIRQAEANIRTFVRYCNETPRIQFALFGGDFINDYDTDHSQAMWCLRHARKDFSGLNIPFYTTRGNHDCNGKQRKADRTPDNRQIITDREYYELFSPRSSSNPLTVPDSIVTDDANPYGNYYYRDFDTQKVRLIVLNNYDSDSLEIYGYHGLQMKWLAEQALDFSAKEDPEQWCFMMLGHAFSISYNNNPVTRLMHAYMEGSEFFDTDSGVSYHGQFQKPRAQFVGMLSGHFHYSMYNNSEGYNMIRFDRGFATGGETDPENLSFSHLVLNTRTKTLEDRHIGRGRSRMFRYDHPSQVYPTQAFPEADGMGAEVSGGRGGRTLIVENLKDSGKGSLRWAIEQQGCRTITFAVSGAISLKSPLVITHDSITIAGQTAPGDGIVLEGQPLQIQASEVIVRYLEINGPATRANKVQKPVSGVADYAFGQSQVMLDHLTLHWDGGPAIDIRHTENATVQFCRIEPVTVYNDCEYPALVAGGFKTTYHHNLIKGWSNAVHFPDEAGCNRWIHLVRNVIIDWKEHAMYGGNNQGEITIEDNYCIPGEETYRPVILDVAEDGTGRYYFKNNSYKGREHLDYKNAQLVNDRSGLPFDTCTLDLSYWSQYNPALRPQHTGFTASCLVIAAFHSRVMFHSPSHEATRQHLQRECGSGYRPERLTEAPTDTDRDGLPDLWEIHHGLNPHDAADSRKMTSSHDYTNLEMYLNELVRPDKAIILLYDNDTYGNFLSYPYLAGYRNIVAADSAYVGIISNGNALSGSLAAEQTQGQCLAALRHKVGYDAVNLGLADLTYPAAHLDGLLQTIGAPVLAANLVRRDGTCVYRPYVIHQYGRKKIAFIGVLPGSIDPSQYPYFGDTEGDSACQVSSDIVTLVQSQVNAARQEGADYVILLSQLGDNNQPGITDTQTLIHRTEQIDVVIDGSANELTPTQYVTDARQKKVLLTRIGSDFESVGKLSISPEGVITHTVLPMRIFRYKDPSTAVLCDSIQRLTHVYHNH